MDYMLSSNAHVYKEQQHLHVPACQSATDAKLAACTKLMAVLQQIPDYSSSSAPPSDHDPPPLYESHPLVSFPSKPNSAENSSHSRHAASLDAAPAPPTFPDDVVFYVGKSRQPFHLNAHSLISGSSYFNRLLQHPLPPPAAAGFSRPPIVIDCEAGIFEALLLLMRYGTIEALPPMSTAEIFRLKKEAEFYGIHYTEPPAKSSTAESGDDCSDMSSERSHLSSPTDSPKSTMNMNPPVADKGACKHMLSHDGVRVACRTSQRLTELPEFPPDLADPGRLVLVSCLDPDKASIYTCDCMSSSIRQAARSCTQWALNFHHRHAFCTSCGHPPNVSPKHFAEMFMAAAVYHSSSGSAEPNCGWWVSSDSTCMLRFISSAGDGPDACGCSAGGGRAAKEGQPTIWAASCFYGHAFCTCCGEVAAGPVLLSLILAVRYGGTNKVSKHPRSSFRMSS